jgi:hypothetical protein
VRVEHQYQFAKKNKEKRKKRNMHGGNMKIIHGEPDGPKLPEATYSCQARQGKAPGDLSMKHVSLLIAIFFWV